VNNITTFETEIDSEDTTTEKKTDFRAKMRKYADKIRSRMTGIRTFKDIATLKVTTNENIVSAKSKMS
jgi:hypothetical protein